MEDMPRSNTANAELRTGAPSSGEKSTRQELTMLRINAASCEGVAVLPQGRKEMPRGFVYFGRSSADILT